MCHGGFGRFEDASLLDGSSSSALVGCKQLIAKMRSQNFDVIRFDTYRTVGTTGLSSVIIWRRTDIIWRRERHHLEARTTSSGIETDATWNTIGH